MAVMSVYYTKREGKKKAKRKKGGVLSVLWIYFQKFV
jgi:hypothetical protein